MSEYCKDAFRFENDGDDSFRMWQGLVGPHYTPSVSNDGTLRWSNNGMLPNPEEVNLRGPQGAGLRIGGIAEETSGLPESADPGTVWLVGAAVPYEGWSYIRGEWIDLGPLTVGPAGPPGPQGDDYTLTEADKAEIAEEAENLLLINLDSSPLPIRAGGTGGNTLESAQNTLGIAALAERVGTTPLSTDAQNLSDAVNELADAVVPEVLPVARGGTGGNTLEDAQANLGIAALKSKMKNVVLQAAVQTISGNGTTSGISLPGLTEDHVVSNWGMFSDANCTTPIPENAPTCDIKITTTADAWSVTITNFSSTFYLRPTFVLKQN